MTADPRELAAVERAGDRSWSDWTYYGRRYGERGRQFTRSDSAWLALLPNSAAAALERQVRWLSEVLAARGMPRLLLEEHLRVLHAELVAAVPERASAYAALLDVADALGHERQSHMPEAAARALEAEFRSLLDRPVDDDLRAATLIAAAVADEQAGLPAAVSSLVDWLASPELFDRSWCEAVHETLRRARARIA